MIFRKNEDGGFGESKMRRLLAAPYRWIAGGVRKFVSRDDKIGVERSFSAKILAAVFLPLRYFGGFLLFMIQAWPPSRQGTAFFKGLPAVMAAGGFLLAFLAADYLFSEARRIGDAAARIEYHFSQSPEFPTRALLFAEKLVELKPDVPEHLYQLGLARDRAGQEAAAFDVMQAVAPEDRALYAPAHLWMSQFYLTSKLLAPMTDPSREALAMKQLEYAIEVAPNSQAANFDLAALRLKQAEQINKTDPEYKLLIESVAGNLRTITNGELTGLRLMAIPQLFELECELGNREKAEARLRSEVTTLLDFARKYPNVYEVWLTAIRCKISLGDYLGAIEIAQEGSRSVSDSTVRQKINQLASQVYAKRANDFENMDDRADYRMRLFSLCKALQMNQSNREVYVQLLKMIEVPEPSQPNSSDESGNLESGGEESSNREMWLKEAVVGGPEPAVIHALLGLQAISAGDVPAGRRHWKIAERQFGRSQVIINNLIDIAAKDYGSEFNNILEMITVGIQLFPDEAMFYRTRGVFFMAEKKWEDAIRDLVYTCEQMPNMIPVHQYLVECYEQTGDSKNVLEQKIILEEKLSQLTQAERKRIEAAIKRLEEVK